MGTVSIFLIRITFRFRDAGLEEQRFRVLGQW